MTSVSVVQTRTATIGSATAAFTAGSGSELSIGADGGTDSIYLPLGARSTSGLSAVVSVEVDGVAASHIVTGLFLDGGSTRSLSSLWAIKRNSLPDPSQTDIDVEIEFDQTVIRAAISSLRSPDAGIVPVGTPVDDDEAGTGNLVLDANTVAGAIVIGAAYSGNITSFTWSGLTEQVDASMPGGSNKWTVATASNVAAERHVRSASRRIHPAP